MGTGPVSVVIDGVGLADASAAIALADVEGDGMDIVSWDQDISQLQVERKVVPFLARRNHGTTGTRCTNQRRGPTATAVYSSSPLLGRSLFIFSQPRAYCCTCVAAST